MRCKVGCLFDSNIYSHNQEVFLSKYMNYCGTKVAQFLYAFSLAYEQVAGEPARSPDRFTHSSVSHSPIFFSFLAGSLLLSTNPNRTTRSFAPATWPKMMNRGETLRPRNRASTPVQFSLSSLPTIEKVGTPYSSVSHPFIDEHQILDNLCFLSVLTKVWFKRV